MGAAEGRAGVILYPFALTRSFDWYASIKAYAASILRAEDGDSLYIILPARVSRY